MLFVLYRMVSPPAGQVDLVSLSLSWGIWLALLSTVAIVAGGILASLRPELGRSRPGATGRRSDSERHVRLGTVRAP